ncbi:MAG: TMEM143 family protein [Prochloraceae cyanobacterium]|nr:TMEM143 family protein [Prochloraceae cyanobacterium]
MAVYEDREAFIPYRRSDIIDMCLEDGKLSEADSQKFRDFCQILAAYFHFKFHHTLESIKYNFAPFDPDSDTQLRVEPTSVQKQKMQAKLIADFKHILERSNYIALSQAGLEKAFEEKSLIELKTDVDFNDFDEMVCFCRGDIYKLTTVTKFFFRKVPLTIDTFERVALLIKIKEADYFKKKKIDPEKLEFTPGKVYVYLYKNIPKFDLEFLFPNVQTSMTVKDRLFFIVPAIGAAVPTVIKVLPQLLFIVGVISFVITGISSFGNFSEEQMKNLMPALIATLSLSMTLGGFAFKQYTSYKTKQIQFQKNITETLFFRNLGINAGVFKTLIDAAEEEETKEIILVYYHLLTSKNSLNPEQLDDRIEEWMEKKFDTKIDFDINGPLDNLKNIRGKLNESDREDLPLLQFDDRGNCQILELDKAKTIIDYIWDNAFRYA